MKRDIRIDEPGAGEWVMDRAGSGTFNPFADHCFSTHDEKGNILGGFVLAGFYGASWAMHQAGIDKSWCSRELLWLIFHYAFEQCKCNKVIAPIPSNNHRAVELCMRAGWQLEAVIHDAVAEDIHLMVLTMTKDQCRWLDFKGQTQWQPREAA